MFDYTITEDAVLQQSLFIIKLNVYRSENYTDHLKNRDKNEHN